MRIKWKGKKRTNAALERYQDALEKKVQRIVVETTETGVSRMKADAPVGKIDGGNLRRKIHPEYANDMLSAKVISGAWYSPFAEYGTGIYSKHPTIPGRSTPWVYYSEELERWVFTRGMHPMPFFNHNADWMKSKFKREMRGL